jgi:arsenate reductase
MTTSEKKVLIMCTGNSCRSIIGEALINKELAGIKALSCGVMASGKVNENAKKVLEINNAWDDAYYSKDLDAVIHEDFDLVVTVCDHAKEQCPLFPKSVKKIHVGFEDPDGKDFTVFEETYIQIYNELLKAVKEQLS